MQVGIIGQLLQHEVSYISLRNFHGRCLVIAWEPVPILPVCTLTIFQSTGSNDRPVKVALFDIFFLKDVVGVRFAQEHAKHNVLPEKV